MTHPHTDLTTTLEAMSSLADTFLQDMDRQDAERAAHNDQLNARRRAEQAAMWGDDLPDQELRA